MQIGRIALKIRAAQTSFGNNVFGTAELALAVNNTLTGKNPVAFVVPVNEEVKDNLHDQAINQILTERFAVIVAVPTDTDQKDKTGLIAYDRLHSLRAEIFRPLIGWDLGFQDLIYYRAGKMLGIDRAWLWYQFEFEYTSRVKTNPDGYGEIEETEVDDRRPVSELPDFNEIYAQYILSPSVKLDEVLADPALDLPITIVAPDMTQLLEKNDDDAGAFAKSFAKAFDIFIR